MTSIKLMFLVSSVMLVLLFTDNTAGNPHPSFGSSHKSNKLDLLGGYDILGVCLRNCAQCKKMFGNYFEGQLCADACVKFKGKVIPDCEDLSSIAPFLTTKLD
ncbi:unnamed protein product [Diamesa hyperborea]